MVKDKAMVKHWHKMVTHTHCPTGRDLVSHSQKVGGILRKIWEGLAIGGLGKCGAYGGGETKGGESTPRPAAKLNPV